MLPVLFIRTKARTRKIRELYVVTGHHIKRQSVISLNHLASKDSLYFSRVIIECPVPHKCQADYYVFDFTGRVFMVRVEEHHYDATLETALYWIDQVDILKHPPYTGLRKRYAIKPERILSTHLTPEEKSIVFDLTRYILNSYPQWLKCFITDSLSYPGYPPC